MWRIGTHWLRLGPPGNSIPAQQTPDEVILLVRQHDVPVAVYPVGQHRGLVEPGRQTGVGGGGNDGWHWPLTTLPAQQAAAPPGPV
jgi:hypothetical protein